LSHELSFFEGLLARLDGPMRLRMVIQPAVAITLAIFDGRKDCADCRVPYFISLVTQPENRREMLMSSWHSIGKVFILAIVLDSVFQHIVFNDINWKGALLAGIILALLPYLIFRGLVNRCLRKMRKSNET